MLLCGFIITQKETIKAWNKQIKLCVPNLEFKIFRSKALSLIYFFLCSLNEYNNNLISASKQKNN